MAWEKSAGDSDKVVSLTGDKWLVSSLTGEKGDSTFPLYGSVDKSNVLLGDKIVTLTVDSDKIISILGSVGVSLEGAKHIAILLGELATTIQLLGEYPYSYFNITIDTTYITIDYIDITIDREIT
jgi:hypothetical protein